MLSLIVFGVLLMADLKDAGCPGCLTTVNGWKNDPVLVKVAMAAIKAAQDHLVAGGTIQSGNRVTAKVVDFQKQVVAGTNFFLTIDFGEPGSTLSFRCKNVRVFRPLLFKCQAPGLCLQPSLKEMNCQKNFRSLK